MFRPQSRLFLRVLLVTLAVTAVAALAGYAAML